MATSSNPAPSLSPFGIPLESRDTGHRYARLARAIFVLGAVVLMWVSAVIPVDAQDTQRARSEREWTVKADKMREHLLPLMREHGVDLWVIMSRENAPDPALELFGGNGITGWYGARNAYLFWDSGAEGLETTVIGTHLSGHLSRFYDHIESYHGEGSGLAPSLQAYVAQRDPERIAINQSRTISMADGITASLLDYLKDAIGPDYSERLVSSEPLFIDYVSTRTDAELEIEREASDRTWNILRRAFSNEVITPGETTLMDVHYWIEGRASQAGSRVQLSSKPQHPARGRH